MSPERQKIVIFSGNCHLSDWSAAGSGGCLRGVPDTVGLIEPRRYYPDMLMLGKNVSARVTDILMTKNLFVDVERDCKSVWNGMCFQ